MNYYCKDNIINRGKKNTPDMQRQQQQQQQQQQATTAAAVRVTFCGETPTASASRRDSCAPGARRYHAQQGLLSVQLHAHCDHAWIGLKQNKGLFISGFDNNYTRIKSFHFAALKKANRVQR